MAGRSTPQGSGTPMCQGPQQVAALQQGGVPAQDMARVTHTLAFLPLATSGAGQAALALPALQERGGVDDETGHGCPHVHVCAHSGAHGSQAGMLQAQPRVCVATSLLELGSVCPGG